uniref:Uncharacterized protein n=1 Tax=Lepisosteus oculatus TaxID=7918 RepID=W5N1X6_LEPOC
ISGEEANVVWTFKELGSFFFFTFFYHKYCLVLLRNSLLWSVLYGQLKPKKRKMTES